jgi:hypothetical protein
MHHGDVVERAIHGRAFIALDKLLLTITGHEKWD